MPKHYHTLILQADPREGSPEYRVIATILRLIKGNIGVLKQIGIIIDFIRVEKRGNHPDTIRFLKKHNIETSPTLVTAKRKLTTGESIMNFYQGIINSHHQIILTSKRSNDPIKNRNNSIASQEVHQADAQSTAYRGNVIPDNVDDMQGYLSQTLRKMDDKDEDTLETDDKISTQQLQSLYETRQKKFGGESKPLNFSEGGTPTTDERRILNNKLEVNEGGNISEFEKQYDTSGKKEDLELDDVQSLISAQLRSGTFEE